MKQAIIFIIILIVIINLPQVNWITGYDDVFYSNSNGSFTYVEDNITGRNYKLVMENFQAFKAVNKEDTLLFRITPMNWLKIWRWGGYLSQEKYKHSYKSWREIEKVRGPIRNKTNWQDF